MRRDGRDYVLSSGRRFYACNGILGIGDDNRAAEGFDGYLSGVTLPDPDKPWIDLTDEEFEAREREAEFTAAERREIAEEMIQRWRQWGGLTAL